MKLLREPLVHFLLLVAGLFLLQWVRLISPACRLQNLSTTGVDFGRGAPGGAWEIG